MGFRLSVVPTIMNAIVNAVLSKDETICQAMLTYIDDIYTNKTIVPTAQVRQHLTDFGLECKNPE